MSTIELINCNEYPLQICSDLRVIGLLVGIKENQQKWPFIYFWNSRYGVKLYNIKHWESSLAYKIQCETQTFLFDSQCKIAILRALYNLILDLGVH